MRRRVLLSATLASLASPARADELDLLLVLAVDASGSVTPDRFELQKQGYVHAFRHPRLQEAVARSAGIAVCMTQWTGPIMQALIVPWQKMTNAAGAEAFAAAIEAAPRRLFSGGTSLSGAIDHAAGLIAQAPHAAHRRVIDISGDGANNRGRPAAQARDDAVGAAITINGLPILAVEPFLDRHYRDQVIGGPGAFMIVAQDFTQFAEAVLRKLVLEIADLPDARHITQRRA